MLKMKSSTSVILQNLASYTFKKLKFLMYLIKSHINHISERKYRNYLDFRLLYNGLKEKINKLNDYWNGTLNGDEY